MKKIINKVRLNRNVKTRLKVDCVKQIPRQARDDKNRSRDDIFPVREDMFSGSDSGRIFYPIVDDQFAKGFKAVDLAKRIVAGGAKILQYRNKRSGDAEFEEIARGILEVCSVRMNHEPPVRMNHESPVRMIVNDRVEIASKIGADGVHVGWDDIKNQELRIKNKKLGVRDQGSRENQQDLVIENWELGIERKEEKIFNLIRDYLGGKGKIVGVTARNVEEAMWAQRNGADYVGLSCVFGTATKTDALPMGISGIKEIVKFLKIPSIAIGGINLENVEQVLKTGVSGVAVISAVCLAEDVEGVTREFVKKSKI